MRDILIEDFNNYLGGIPVFDNLPYKGVRRAFISSLQKFKRDQEPGFMLSGCKRGAVFYADAFLASREYKDLIKPPKK